MPKVVKADNTLEEFDKNKIIQSCINAGASEGIAKEIADEVEKKYHEDMRTSEIRRIVLRRLSEANPEWADNWRFYDRIVKGRITFDNGKYIVVEKGNIYLGRQVRDIGKKGLSDVEEVKAILNELQEDLVHGISPRTIHNRTRILFLAVLRTSKMSKEDKLKSIELINEFRKKQGWKPFELKKPLK